jgi:hypothetical protein
MKKRKDCRPVDIPLRETSRHKILKGAVVDRDESVTSTPDFY